MWTVTYWGGSVLWKGIHWFGVVVYISMNVLKRKLPPPKLPNCQEIANVYFIVFLLQKKSPKLELLNQIQHFILFLVRKKFVIDSMMQNDWLFTQFFITKLFLNHKIVFLKHKTAYWLLRRKDKLLDLNWRCKSVYRRIQTSLYSQMLSSWQPSWQISLLEATARLKL